MNSLIFNSKIIEALQSLDINLIDKRVYDSYALDMSNKKDSSKSNFKYPAMILHHDSFKTAKNEARSETAFYFFAIGNSNREAQLNCLKLVSAFEEKIASINSQFKYENFHVFIRGDKNFVFDTIESEPIDEESIFCYFGETNITVKEI